MAVRAAGLSPGDDQSPVHQYCLRRPTSPSRRTHGDGADRGAVLPFPGRASAQDSIHAGPSLTRSDGARRPPAVPVATRHERRQQRPATSVLPQVHRHVSMVSRANRCCRSRGRYPTVHRCAMEHRLGCSPNICNRTGRVPTRAHLGRLTMPRPLRQALSLVGLCIGTPTRSSGSPGTIVSRHPGSAVRWPKPH